MSEDEEKYICYYCNKESSSGFMLRQHISYAHKGLIEFESSNIYKSLLKRLKTLEETNEILLKKIKNLEENQGQK